MHLDAGLSVTNLPPALTIAYHSPMPLQHDDAITSRTYDAMRSVTDGVEASGCPATATMFVTSTGTGALWLGGGCAAGGQRVGSGAAASACRGSVGRRAASLLCRLLC